MILSLEEFKAMNPILHRDAREYPDSRRDPIPTGTGTETGFFIYNVPRNRRGTYKMVRCRCYRMANDVKLLCKYDIRWDHWLESGRQTMADKTSHSKNAVTEPGLGAHKHTFEAFTIEEAISRPISTKLKCPEMYEKLAIFGAKTNIALDKLVSREFFDIIYTAGDYLLSQQRRNPSTPIHASEELKKIGVDRIRELVISTSDAKVTEALRKLALKKFVCICLDAGQVRRRHWLDFIVCHGETEVPFDIQDTENLDATRYKARAVAMLQKLREYHVHVACFVGDGLQAQINALDSTLSTSFQKSYTKSELRYNEFRKIMFFPCWIHRIQLVYRHVDARSKRDETFFHETVKLMHRLATRLRKTDAQKAIGSLCPAPIETRWLFSYDIAVFIQEHRTTIRDFLSSTEDLPLTDAIGPAYHIMNLLEPLRALTLVLSEKGRRACDVLPYVSQAYERLKAVEVPDHWRTIKTQMIDELKTLTVRSTEGSMLITAYYMTLQGKYAFMPQSLDNSDGIEAPRSFLPNIHEHPETIRFQSDQLANRVGADDEPDSDSDDETHTEDTQSPDTEEAPADPIQSLVPRSGLNRHIEVGLRQWGVRMQMDSGRVTRALNQLWAFLNEPVTDIPFYGLWLTGDEAVWNANSAGGPYGDLAEIAERVVIIPASEVSCERAISLQGYIQTKRNARSKPDLLTAKLAHLCE